MNIAGDALGQPTKMVEDSIDKIILESGFIYSTPPSLLPARAESEISVNFTLGLLMNDMNFVLQPQS